jgi:hypothetical protein
MSTGLSDEIRRYAARRCFDITNGKNPDYFACLEQNWLRNIAYVMHILYREPQLNADDMRDLAQVLDESLRHVEFSE